MKKNTTNPPAESGPQLLSVPQVAQRLNCSERFIRQEISAGRLAEVNIGRLVRVTEKELGRYVSERTRPSFDAKKTAAIILKGGTR